MKTEFTPEERKEIYLRLSEKVDEGINGFYFVCWKLWREMGNNGVYTYSSDRNVYKAFPEFEIAYNKYRRKNEKVLDHEVRKDALLYAASIVQLT